MSGSTISESTTKGIQSRMHPSESVKNLGTNLSPCITSCTLPPHLAPHQARVNCLHEPSQWSLTGWCTAVLVWPQPVLPHFTVKGQRDWRVQRVWCLFISCVFHVYSMS